MVKRITRAEVQPSSLTAGRWIIFCSAEDTDTNEGLALALVDVTITEVTYAAVCDLYAANDPIWVLQDCGA